MKKWLYVNGTYHQWTRTSTDCPYNRKDRDGNLLRFRDLIKLYKSVLDLKADVLIGGDLNIYHWRANYPEARHGLRLMIPKLEVLPNICRLYLENWIDKPSANTETSVLGTKS